MSPRRSVTAVGRRMVLFAFACVVLHGGAFAQTFHVDPAVAGPGTGAANDPFPSITAALAAAAGGSTPLDLRLAAGVYQAPAETFPLTLPEDCVISAAWRGAAVIADPTTTGSTLLAPASTSLWISDVVVQCGNTALRVELGATQTNVFVERCVFTADRGAFFPHSGGFFNSYLSFTDTSVVATNDGIVVDAEAWAAYLFVDDVLVRAADRGIDLEARFGGYAELQMSRSRVSSAVRTGVRARATDSASVSRVFIDRSVFFGNGTTTNPTSGAIVDASTSGGSAEFYLTNLAFLQNSVEMPPPPVTVVAHLCCFQSAAAAAAAPGLFNISGDPLFIDAANDDFRLQPGSPCIDAGGGPFFGPGADPDGDPQTPPSGGAWPAVMDIGADEFFDLAIASRFETAGTGQNLVLDFTGIGGRDVWLIASSTANPAFGSGLQIPLSPLPVVVNLGPMPAGAVTQRTVSLSAAGLGTPAIDVFVQAAYVDASTSATAFSYNVATFLLTP